MVVVSLNRSGIRINIEIDQAAVFVYLTVLTPTPLHSAFHSPPPRRQNLSEKEKVTKALTKVQGECDSAQQKYYKAKETLNVWPSGGGMAREVAFLTAYQSMGIWSVAM